MGHTGDEQRELLEAVRDALAPLIPGASRARIVPPASLLRDLGMDSLKVVELTLGLEQVLGRPVFLPDWIASVDDPDELTVGSLIDYLARSAA